VQGCKGASRTAAQAEAYFGEALDCGGRRACSSSMSAMTRLQQLRDSACAPVPPVLTCLRSLLRAGPGPHPAGHFRRRRQADPAEAGRRRRRRRRSGGGGGAGRLGGWGGGWALTGDGHAARGGQILCRATVTLQEVAIYYAGGDYTAHAGGDYRIAGSDCRQHTTRRLMKTHSRTRARGCLQLLPPAYYPEAVAAARGRSSAAPAAGGLTEACRASPAPGHVAPAQATGACAVHGPGVQDAVGPCRRHGRHDGRGCEHGRRRGRGTRAWPAPRARDTSMAGAAGEGHEHGRARFAVQADVAGGACTSRHVAHRAVSWLPCASPAQRPSLSVWTTLQSAVRPCASPAQCSAVSPWRLAPRPVHATVLAARAGYEASPRRMPSASSAPRDEPGCPQASAAILSPV
jgi:hypothetical protein